MLKYHFLFYLLLPLSALAAPFLDQYQGVWTTSEPPVAIGASSQQFLAQTVTAGARGQLHKIQLLLNCNDSTRGDITVGLTELDSDGRPGGLSLGSVAVDSATLVTSTPDLYALHDFFIPGVAFSRGDTFAITIKAGTSVVCTMPIGPVEGSWFPYTPGRAWFIADPNDRDVWLPLNDPPTDFPFYTWTERPSHGGTSALCEFHSANGSPNDWLTADVPVCGCLEDPVLQRHNCWFAFPDFLAWRVITLNPDLNEAPVEWSVVPLSNKFGGVEMMEAGLKDGYLTEVVSFSDGMAAGKVYQLKTTIKGQVSGTEAVVKIRRFGKQFKTEFEFWIGEAN